MYSDCVLYSGYLNAWYQGVGQVEFSSQSSQEKYSKLIFVGRIQFFVVAGMRFPFPCRFQLRLLPVLRDHLYSLPSNLLHLQASNGTLNHFCASNLWLPFLGPEKTKTNKETYLFLKSSCHYFKTSVIALF